MDALNSVDSEKYDFILLGYGLCGNGILNVTHSKIPVVLSKVQDCVPLIIGSKERHSEYVRARLGTFWYSVGWIEGFPLPGSPDYVEKYREFYNLSINEAKRDAIEGMLIENYTHLTFIRWDELGQRISEHGRSYTKSCVTSLNERLGFNLEYDELKGDPNFLQRFVDGEWDDKDFLILEPGKRLQFDALESRLFSK